MLTDYGSRMSKARFWLPELTGDRFPLQRARAVPLDELTGRVARVVETGLKAAPERERSRVGRKSDEWVVTEYGGVEQEAGGCTCRVGEIASRLHLQSGRDSKQAAPAEWER